MYVKKGVPINNYQIDISNYSKGVYFLRINSEKGTFTSKVIKN